MHPHLQDSMKFLYMKEDVGYEEFLATVYEAETEGSEAKVLNVKVKAMTVEKITDNKGKNELKDVKPKVVEGVSSPRKKEVLGNSPQKGIQGSPRKGKDL